MSEKIKITHTRIDLTEETKIISDALTENISDSVKGGSLSIINATLPCLVSAALLICAQLTRIAAALEKKPCQDCCNTAGENIIKEYDNEKDN